MNNKFMGGKNKKTETNKGVTETDKRIKQKDQRQIFSKNEFNLSIFQKEHIFQTSPWAAPWCDMISDKLQRITGAGYQLFVFEDGLAFKLMCRFLRSVIVESGGGWGQRNNWFYFQIFQDILSSVYFSNLTSVL